MKRGQDAETRAEIERAWTTTGETATEIATRLGVTKSVVIGVAHLRGWERPKGTRWVGFNGPEPTTLFQRMDALEATYKAKIAQIAIDHPNQHRAPGDGPF